jgi:hypothetical protein
MLFSLLLPSFALYHTRDVPFAVPPSKQRFAASRAQRLSENSRKDQTRFVHLGGCRQNRQRHLRMGLSSGHLLDGN